VGAKVALAAVIVGVAILTVALDVNASPTKRVLLALSVVPWIGVLLWVLLYVRMSGD
jgi:hypothetical protein